VKTENEKEKNDRWGNKKKLFTFSVELRIFFQFFFSLFHIPIHWPTPHKAAQVSKQKLDISSLFWFCQLRRSLFLRLRSFLWQDSHTEKCGRFRIAQYCCLQQCASSTNSGINKIAIPFRSGNSNETLDWWVKNRTCFLDSTKSIIFFFLLLRNERNWEYIFEIA